MNACLENGVLKAVLNVILRGCRAEVGFGWFYAWFGTFSLLVSTTSKSVEC